MLYLFRMLVEFHFKVNNLICFYLLTYSDSSINKLHLRGAFEYNCLLKALALKCVRTLRTSSCYLESLLVKC